MGSEDTSDVELAIRSTQLMGLLGSFAQCEGIAEEIAYLYLEPVPEQILQALLGQRRNRPWTQDQVGRLLDAVLDLTGIRLTIDHEGLQAHYQNRLEYQRHRVGPRQGDYHLVAEWRWATEIRNDIAHSSLAYADHASPGTRGRRYILHPRSARHEIKRMTTAFNEFDLQAQSDRMEILLLQLMRIYVEVKS